MNGRTRTCARVWPAVSDGRDAGGAGPVSGPEVQSSCPGTRGHGAEVGAAESSPVIHRDRVCRDDAVPSADTARAKGTSALTFLAISDPVSLRIRKGCVAMQG